MNIDVIKLKKNISILSKLIENYELNNLAFYNIANSNSIFWNTDKGFNFFESVNLEKMEIEKFINEIKEILTIFNYIVNKYEYIGVDIIIIPSNIDKLLSCFDNLLNEIYNLIDNFYEVISINNSLLSINFYDCVDNLIDVGNMLVNLKSIIKKYFDLYITFEKTIKSKIDKIDVKLINETDISNFM